MSQYQNGVSSFQAKTKAKFCSIELPPCSSNPRRHAASIILCSLEMDGIPAGAEMLCAANVAENSDEDASDESNIYKRLRFHKWHQLASHKKLCSYFGSLSLPDF